MKPVAAFVPTSLTLVWIHRVSLGVCSTGTHIQLCVVSSKFLARWTSPQKRRNYFLRRARGRLRQAQGAGHVPTPFTMLFCSPKNAQTKLGLYWWPWAHMCASVCLRKSTGSHQKVKSMCLGEIGTRVTFFRSQLEQRQLLHDRIKCLRKTRSCDEIAFLALAKEKKNQLTNISKSQGISLPCVANYTGTMNTILQSLGNSIDTNFSGGTYQ